MGNSLPFLSRGEQCCCGDRATASRGPALLVPAPEQAEVDSDGEGVDGGDSEVPVQSEALPQCSDCKRWELNGLVFDCDFDSGNCGGVSEVACRNPGKRIFKVYVRSDCEGTPLETSECAWFHFTLSGDALRKGLKLEFRLGNPKHKLKLRRLLYDGMKPVTRSLPSSPNWAPVADEGRLRLLKDKTTALSFGYTVGSVKPGEVISFATCFPYPFDAVMKFVEGFEAKMKSLGAYTHREKLCSSLEGRPVELLTVTSGEGEGEERQPALPGLASEGPRPKVFPGRRAVFVSARVHPGETPASYLLEGLLRALAGARKGLDAKELLRRYVFFVIPVLNPDGVAMGHHRTDSQGVNLNRMYGEADARLHAPIFAAEAACLACHKAQGGVRLYLDLHAHGTRRGCFVFGDAGEEGLTGRSRLFCYALARRCGVFDYSQSVFTHSSMGTGKALMSASMPDALCFTLETNYHRGHLGAEPFTPATWLGLGAACLEALCDLDTLEAAGSPMPPPGGEDSEDLSELSIVQPSTMEEDLVSASKWLAASCAAWSASKRAPPPMAVSGPSRAKPEFAVVRSPSEEHSPSQELWMHPECLGQAVELVACSRGKGNSVYYTAEFPDGSSMKIPERDLTKTEALKGRFFYRVIHDAAVTEGPEDNSPVLHALKVGTLLEASQRMVVGGSLRVLVAGNDGGHGAGGWVSEYRSAAFDPRLGGSVQLMRLQALPGSKAEK